LNWIIHFHRYRKTATHPARVSGPKKGILKIYVPAGHRHSTKVEWILFNDGDERPAEHMISRAFGGLWAANE
jgi:hypothetical protein